MQTQKKYNDFVKLMLEKDLLTIVKNMSQSKNTNSEQKASKDRPVFMLLACLSVCIIVVVQVCSKNECQQSDWMHLLIKSMM